MKTMKYFLISVLMFCMLPLSMAQSSDVPSDIISAMGDGNANKLSEFLNTNVELVIGNKNDVFSKQQASGIVADFFRANRVNSFQVLHKGNKDAASFVIGELKTSGGTYRVYILTRKAVIQQLRIEPSND